MIYIRRELERKYLQMSQAFKAVMVVGARQVGKSTMLKQLAKGEQRTYVTMDDIQLRQFAQSMGQKTAEKGSNPFKKKGKK